MLRVLVLMFLLAGCVGPSQPSEGIGEAPAATVCEATQAWTHETPWSLPTLQVLGSGVGGWSYEDRTLEPDTTFLRLVVWWNQSSGDPSLVVDILADGSPDGRILATSSGDSPLHVEWGLNETMRKIRVRTQTETTEIGPITTAGAAPLTIHYELTETAGSC